LLAYSVAYFSSLLPRPPGPALFPYTTLFRSPAVRGRDAAVEGGVPDRLHARPAGRHLPRHRIRRRAGARCDRDDGPDHRRRGPRSEEHTSELQSRENLVCRLLLEKKKHAT